MRVRRVASSNWPARSRSWTRRWARRTRSCVCARSVQKGGLAALGVDGLFPSPHAEVVDLVQGALQDAGLRVTRLEEESGFARLRVDSGDDSTTVDLGADYRLAAPVRTGAGECLRWKLSPLARYPRTAATLERGATKDDRSVLRLVAGAG